LGQLDQVNKNWRDHLAQENEGQHKRLKAALEERRRAAKKLNGELANKRQAKLKQAAATALDAILDTDEARAEDSGRLLVDKIDQEFQPDDVARVTEYYLDRVNQEQPLELMNAMFAQRSKALKKMLFELMSQKHGEYELIRGEFEP